MTPDGVLFSSLPHAARASLGDPRGVRDRDGLQKPDDHRPLFVNSDYNAPDDMGDWWLDLGHIDLPA